MSSWEERYSNHRVFAALQAARDALNAADPVLDEDGFVDQRQRFDRVFEALEERFKRADPMLVTVPVLDGIAASLDNFTAQIQSYVSNRVQGYLSNAEGYADGVVSAFPQLTATEGRDVEDFQATVSSFRRSVGQLNRNASDEVATLRGAIAQQQAELQAQEQKIVAQDQRLDAVVTQAQTELSALQNRGQTEFNQVIADARAELQKTVTEAERTATSVEQEVQKRVEVMLDEAESAVTQRLQNLDGRMTEGLKATDERTRSHLDEMDRLLAQAVETVGAIGSTGLTAGYQVVANNEAKEAGRMRLLAIVSLALAAAAAVVFAWLETRGHNSWNVSLTKSLVSVPLLLLAAYAARESSRHRSQAQSARQIELQLASMGSYLVDLPTAERQKVRERLADRFFGDPRVINADENGSGLPQLPTSLP